MSNAASVVSRKILISFDEPVDFKLGSQVDVATKPLTPLEMLTKGNLDVDPVTYNERTPASKMIRITHTFPEQSISNLCRMRPFRLPFYASDNTDNVGNLPFKDEDTTSVKLPDFKLKPKSSATSIALIKSRNQFSRCNTNNASLQLPRLVSYREQRSDSHNDEEVESENDEVQPLTKTKCAAEEAFNESGEHFQEETDIHVHFPFKPRMSQTIQDDDAESDINNSFERNNNNQIPIGIERMNNDKFRPPEIPSNLKIELENAMYAIQNSPGSSHPIFPDNGQGENQQQVKNSNRVHHISFHYQTNENGDLYNLTPTGVSVDFHCPVAPKNSGQASSYFPRAKAVRRSWSNEEKRSQKQTPPPSTASDEKVGPFTSSSSSLERLQTCGVELNLPILKPPKNRPIIRNIPSQEITSNYFPRKSISRQELNKKRKSKQHEEVNRLPKSRATRPKFSSYYRDLSERIRNSINFPKVESVRSQAALLAKYNSNFFPCKTQTSESEIVMATSQSIRNILAKSRALCKKHTIPEMSSQFHTQNKSLKSLKNQTPFPPDLRNREDSDFGYVSYENILKMPMDQMPSFSPGRKGSKTSKKSKKVVKPQAIPEQKEKESESDKSKPTPKAKSSFTARKVKLPMAPDPYFMNASDSEKEIIKELVKADVEAMLERDAVALLPVNAANSATTSGEGRSKKIVEPTFPPPPTKKELATHWSYRLHPLHNDNKQIPAAKVSRTGKKVGSATGSANNSRPSSKSKSRAKIGTTKLNSK